MSQDPNSRYQLRGDALAATKPLSSQPILSEGSSKLDYFRTVQDLKSQKRSVLDR